MYNGVKTVACQTAMDIDSPTESQLYFYIVSCLTLFTVMDLLTVVDNGSLVAEQHQTQELPNLSRIAAGKINLVRRRVNIQVSR